MIYLGLSKSWEAKEGDKDSQRSGEFLKVTGRLHGRSAA
jgi:hypothetical protein